MKCLRNDSQGFPLTPTCVCGHARMHTHTHTTVVNSYHLFSCGQGVAGFLDQALTGALAVCIHEKRQECSLYGKEAKVHGES